MDIVVQKYQDETLVLPISLEVNGVFHYCRNNELPLGKDILKQKFLGLKGYQSI